jgi:hypothetical protein
VANLPTPHDGTATRLLISTATTGGVTQTFTMTNLVISNTNPSGGDESDIDIAHLGQTTGELAARQKRPLVVPAADGGSGRSLTFDYIGTSILNDGQVGTYVVTVSGITLVGGAGTASLYTVQSSTLTLATNDVIRGQATLTLAR